MITTVVPAAPARVAKTRLAGVLDDPARADLARRLLARTVTAARSLGEVVVVSPSPRMRALAHDLGATTLDDPRADLNAAVTAGLAVAADRGGDALVLPSDLPRVTPAALAALAARAEGLERVVVIAPCQRDEGTNALLVRPADLLRPAFGRDSLATHLAAAAAAGATTLVHHSPDLVDLDTPSDWRAFGPVDAVG